MSRLMVLIALLGVPWVARAAEDDADFFVDKVYPLLREAQCHMCHNDNGVASETRLDFPVADADRDRVAAFGFGLIEVVDRTAPEKSRLYLKPTNRLPHPGGERIKVGGEGEKLLLEWARRLAVREPERLAARSRSEFDVAPKTALGVRRLTHSQYNNAVRDLVGELSRPADHFPPEDYIHGFKNQVHGQSISPLLMEAYSAAAEKVARNAFRGGDRNRLLPCEAAGLGDAACHERFVREFGPRAFRRPLTEDEVDRYAGLAVETARDEGDFLAGPRIVVEAMLQSPHFLMRVEHGPGSPLESYDNASKLSFFIWNTIPDQTLLEAAARDQLRSREQLEAAARRMLDHPQAKGSMEEFLAQWLRFDRALNTIRDRKYFPEFNSELAAAMTEETRRLFNRLAWSDADFMEFFTADYTFINADLAKLYDLPSPDEPFGRVGYPSGSPRAGVLGQGTFLTLTSKPSDTSPTERGLFVREHFLCQIVPPPPPGVNATLPALTDEKPMTNRERLGVHLQSEACVGCHRLVDPIGLGLEHFDAIGRYRETHLVKIPPTRDQLERKIKTETTEYHLEIDASAEIAGVADSRFATPRELGEILATNPSCRRCVVKQLFRYAMGRDEGPADREAIDAALERFAGSGFRFRELILAIVASEPFLGDSEKNLHAELLN